MKKPDLLCKSFSLLPLEKFSLEIIGDGDMKTSLESEYSDYITFHGYRTDTSDFLANLDLLVIPGQGGIVALESLYQNTYVLVSLGADMAVLDAIHDGVNGEFFPKSISPVNLAMQISNIAEHSKLVDSRCGRDLIEEKFSTAKMVEVFKEVLSVDFV